MHLSRHTIILMALSLLARPSGLMAADLETLTNCVWVASKANDGDSFLVKAGNKQLHVRLYFVDCPETLVTTDADAKRVREQARYFGLTDVQKVVDFGSQASAFTKKAMEKSFTIHTSYADAMGRSRGGRIYAFVTTHDGQDLAALLVENGLARVYGTKRSTPDGKSSESEQKRLASLETKAMANRVGIWAGTDPKEITRLRELQRQEDQEIQAIRKQLSSGATVDSPIDLNTASASELQGIDGIGPSLATAIIKGRPYKSVDDLMRVDGIGPKLLEKVRPYVKVDPPKDR